MSFIAGDSQTYPFADGGFDVTISRFGVMFFDDPAAAFATSASGFPAPPRGRAR